MLILNHGSHCFTDFYIIHLVISLDVDILKLSGDDNIQLCLKVNGSGTESDSPETDIGGNIFYIKTGDSYQERWVNTDLAQCLHFSKNLLIN